MLNSICYISNSRILFDKDLLHLFFDLIKKRNDAVKISGLLLYHDGTFVQVLEGDPSAVEVVFSKIKKDGRHNQITIMIDREIQHRHFTKYQTSSISSGNDLELRKLRTRVNLPKASSYTKSLWAVLKPFYLDRPPILYGYGLQELENNFTV
ncbi:BLUF domain-containing protein [Aequorivita sp. CIP111184]|uniref:BLUF domain-containing protein n=1 Tax=Aequorivita sp. CIP111184 TaxID=2211356 RepID=UPI000DBBDFB5|nr:BLUF domain-containing protein [Aequorivita sp. CIP111184]SRX54850.1 hypothetical protein AEQU1_01868 [Aequorivita sp. CIP111184]